MDSVKDFWIGLGDFWTSFENRSEIEDFWEGMFGAFENLSKNTQLAYLSKYLKYSFSYWDLKYFDMKLISTGPFSNIAPGSSTYYLRKDQVGIYSIPTLKVLETGQSLTENSDYNIIDCNRINFTTALTPNPNGTELNIVGDTYKQSDFMTFNVYRPVAGLNQIKINQDSFHAFTYDGDTPSSFDVNYLTEKAIYLKYIVWGIYYLRRQIPTVKNLKWMYNILYNLPFSYEAGTASISSGVLTIGNYSYYNSAGSWDISDGDHVEQFQPLTDNVIIYDRYNNETLINNTFNVLQRASSFIVDVTTLSRTDYIQSIIDLHKENYSLKNMNVKYDVS